MAVPSRIVVKGASGSGKTTLARRLSERLSLPYVELDALNHGPDWTEASDEVFAARIEAATAGDGWVVDGNYETKIGDLVVERADTIVWLDTPLRVNLARLGRRTFRRIRDDVELWNGNRETWRGVLWGRESLFAWAIRSHRRHRRQWPGRFAAPKFAGVQLVRLRSTREADRWLESIPAAGDRGADG